MITSVTLAIPTNSQVNFLKKIGDIVREGEEIAEYLATQDSIEINIASALQISPKSASKFLMKNLGDLVDRDEIIARREKGLFFKKTITIKSLLAGKIFELDNFSGKVKIVGHPVKKKLKSLVSGRIKEETNNKIVIEFKGEEIKLKKCIGDSFFTIVEKISDVNDEVNGTLINVDYKDKMLLGGHFSLSDLNKAMAIGARGVLAARLNENSIERFQSEKVICVGTEERRMTIAIGILTEEDFVKMAKHENHAIYFDGVNGKIIIPT
jgi:hypothetical protein